MSPQNGNSTAEFKTVCLPSEITVDNAEGFFCPDITERVPTLVGRALIWIRGSRYALVVRQCSVRFYGMTTRYSYNIMASLGRIANAAQMPPIAADVTRSVVCQSLCLSVCLLGTRVSSAKTAEPIEMPFNGRLAWVGPRNHVLDASRDLSTGSGNVLQLSTWGSLCCSVRSKRIIQSSNTAGHAMRPFVIILWSHVYHHSS